LAEIKWIKITTDMFEDEKIDFISSLPEADALIVIWIRLLTLAGKCNAGGYVFLTEKIPYTEEMLAHKFKKPLNIIKLALETFQRLDMIEIDERGIFLPNWDKHQNIEGMERVRMLTNERVKKHRQKKKALLEPSNVTCNVTVTQSNATDIDKDKDIEIDKEIKEEEKEEDMTGMTILDAYYHAFKHWNMTGAIQGYVVELLNRGVSESFIVEIILEMGERGIGPNKKYMEKMAEDWLSKGIMTRQQAQQRNQAINVRPVRTQPRQTKPEMPLYTPTETQTATDADIERILAKGKRVSGQ